MSRITTTRRRVEASRLMMKGYNGCFTGLNETRKKSIGGNIHIKKRSYQKKPMTTIYIRTNISHANEVPRVPIGSPRLQVMLTSCN